MPSLPRTRQKSRICLVGLFCKGLDLTTRRLPGLALQNHTGTCDGKQQTAGAQGRRREWRKNKLSGKWLEFVLY